MLVRLQGSTDGGATWKWLKVDADGHLQADVLSIAGGSLLFLYEDRIAERIADENADAGQNFLYSTACPSGKVQVITCATGFNSTTAITSVAIGIYDGSDYYGNNFLLPTAVGQQASIRGDMILKAGDKVYALFEGCLLNDNIRLTINGYQIAV